jgi:hypothetical protein
VRSARSRLANLERGKAAEFAVRMARLKVEKAEEDRASRLASVSATVPFGIEEEEVAVGILQVVG